MEKPGSALFHGQGFYSRRLAFSPFVDSFQLGKFLHIFFYVLFGSFFSFVFWSLTSVIAFSEHISKIWLVKLHENRRLIR